MWSLLSLKCIILVIRALENATLHVLFLGNFWVLYSFKCFLCVSGKKHMSSLNGREPLSKVTDWNRLKILIYWLLRPKILQDHIDIIYAYTYASQMMFSFFLC